MNILYFPLAFSMSSNSDKPRPNSVLAALTALARSLTQSPPLPSSVNHVSVCFDDVTLSAPCVKRPPL